MILSSLKYSSFDLKFKNQFRTSKTSLQTRRVFTVIMKDEKGRKFYGESAPLPEFGSETFEEVERDFQRLLKIKNIEVDSLPESIFEKVNSLSDLPSVQNAIEQILFTKMIKDKGELKSFDFAQSLPVNALITIDDFESSQKKVEKIISDGYSAIKIKVSDKNFEEILKLISWTIGELGVNVKFRIDPNGSWNLKNTILRAERLETFPVEYIEQPVPDRLTLIKAAKESPIPIAVDESVKSKIDAEKLLAESKIKFFIAKPMLLGGVSKILELNNLCKNNDASCIISSSLESSIGRRHLILAAAITNNNLVHGIGTTGLFSNQQTNDQFPVKNGIVNFALDKYSSDIKIEN